MNHILISVDPGLMTGMCIVDVSDMDAPKPIEDYELGVLDFFEKIDELILKYASWKISVVVEDFLITTETGKKTPQPYSLWLIGVLKYLCFKHGLSLDMQKPADKSFVPDTKEGNSKLRKVGFWTKGGAGHQHDAYRHAVVWIVNKNPIWTKNLIL